MAAARGEFLQQRWSLPAVEVPDPAQERKIDLLGASRSHVGADLAVGHDYALYDAPQAATAGIVEPDDGVRTGQSEIKRRTVVTLHDPSLACDEFDNLCAPFTAWRFNPTGSPKLAIEMDERQVGLTRQYPCEGGLSSARAADDYYTPHEYSLQAGSYHEKSQTGRLVVVVGSWHD